MKKYIPRFPNPVPLEYLHKQYLKKILHVIKWTLCIYLANIELFRTILPCTAVFLPARDRITFIVISTYYRDDIYYIDSYIHILRINIYMQMHSVFLQSKLSEHIS